MAQECQIAFSLLLPQSVEDEDKKKKRKEISRLDILELQLNPRV
jgi:hypothetical protein